MTQFDLEAEIKDQIQPLFPNLQVVFTFTLKIPIPTHHRKFSCLASSMPLVLAAPILVTVGSMVVGAVGGMAAAVVVITMVALVGVQLYWWLWWWYSCNGCCGGSQCELL